MTTNQAIPELAAEQLLPLMVAAEHRNRERRRGHTVLFTPLAPCSLCRADVHEQVISPLAGPLDVDNRLVVNKPCGCRMSYRLTAAEQLVDQVRHIVDQEENTPVGQKPFTLNDAIAHWNEYDDQRDREKNGEEAPEDELASLRRQVEAARKFAAEMRDFCSPHGVSAHYADQLEAAMDRAKKGVDGRDR